MIQDDTARPDRPEAPTIEPPTSGSSEGPRFLCDRMLIRLCHWLRAAGYDTSLAGERTSDQRLLKMAMVEQRYLLTRDRKLLEHSGATGRVIRLQAIRPANQAAELAQRLALDWLYVPFSRCLLCNEPLHVDSGRSAPPGSHGPFRRCPSCARCYWNGGHVRRMRAQLTMWRRTASTGMHRADESFIL